MIETFALDLYGSHAEFVMNLDPTVPHERLLLQHKQHNVVYEPEVARVLMRTVHEGDVVIDVGANVGFFTLMMASLVGKQGVVHAFEPVAVTRERLRRNAVSNGFESVFIHKEVAWSTPQLEIPFFTNTDDSAGSAVWDPGLWHENPRSRDAPKVDRCLTLTLGSLDLQRVKLIKIDAEGAEQNILEGARQLLAAGVPYIIAELNPFGMQQLGNDTETLREMMRDYGKQLFFLHGADRLPTLVPQRTSVTHLNGCVVKNVLFSSLEDVSIAWPEAME